MPYLLGDRDVSLRYIRCGTAIQVFYSNEDVCASDTMTSKIFVAIFILCSVQACLSKPSAESNLTEGRGIGSTLWGWVTYPFSWWGSQPEPPPINEQFIAPTSQYEPVESIEVEKHNVTVWCNDQTCTTQKCDKFGCNNMTCSIYDTNLMGECREYNTISTPEAPVPKPTQPLPKPSSQDKMTEITKAPDTTTVAPAVSTTHIEQRPLKLEMVLSSTVNASHEKVADNKEVLIRPEQKV